LVATEHALDWDAGSLIPHVAACARCRDVLRDMERLHTVAPPTDVDAGFEVRVTTSFRSARTRDPRRLAVANEPPRPAVAGGRSSRTVAFGVFGLSSACAWLALAFSWWASASPPDASAGTLPPLGLTILALATGTAVAWRARGA
jgi:hypothetical protein